MSQFTSFDQVQHSATINTRKDMRGARSKEDLALCAKLNASRKGAFGAGKPKLVKLKAIVRAAFNPPTVKVIFTR